MTASKLLDQLKTGVNANPRLRLAMPLLAMLLTVFLWQELAALRGQVLATARSEQLRLEKIKALKGQDVWLTRSVESTQLLDALVAELPTVATSGLAQAAVQTHLAGLVRSLGSTRDVRITAEQVADDALPDGVIRIRATLTGGMTARQAMELLQKIEGAGNLAVIDRLDIQSGVNQVMSATFSAYYQLTPTERGTP